MKPHTRKEREVWHALGSLLEQDFRPDDMTGEIIADRLLALGYNRGSNSDIYRFKRTWLAAQNGPIEQDNHPGSHYQRTLSDPITQAAQVLQEKLKSEAQLEIDKVKKDADEKIHHAQATMKKLECILAEATEKNERLQQQLSQLEKEKNDLSKSFQQEVTHHHGTQQREVTLRDQIEVSERNYESFISDLKSTQKESNDHLKQQLSEMTSNHKSEISDYKTLLESQRQQYSVQLDNFKVENEKLNQALYKCQAKIKQSEFNLNNKDSEINRLELELMTVKKDHQIISNQLKEAKSDYSDKLAEKERQLLLTQGRLEQCIQSLEKSEAKNNRLQTELMTSKEKMATLESQYQLESKSVSRESV